MCKDIDMIKYYQNLSNKNRIQNLLNKKVNRNNNLTMNKRYTELTEHKFCYALYELYINEDLRKTITRWRLSSHDLEIEIGRINGIPQENRFCKFCDNIVENEEHVIYYCQAYKDERKDFQELHKFDNIKSLLNPQTKEEAIIVGKFLKTIEKRRKSLL